MNPFRILMTIIVAAALAAASAPAAAGIAPDRSWAVLDRTAYAPGERTALREDLSRALQAGVPAEDLEIIVARSGERGASAAVLKDLIGSTIAAGEQGLPMQPVLERIEQGLAKGAPPERIAAASRRLVQKLALAGPLVDGLAKQGLRSASSRERADAIESVARAMERPVPDDIIRKTGETAKANGRSMAQFDRAVRSISFLVGSGIAADRAAEVIAEGLEHGLTDQDYARLERNADEALRKGGTEDDALRAAERGMREGRGDDRGGGMPDRGSGGRDVGGRGGRGR